MTSAPAPAHTVPPRAEGRRLVDHVREHLPVVSARRVGPLIAEGAVRIDGVAGRIAEPLRTGQRLTVDPTAIERLLAERRALLPEDLALPVVHEDDDLLVVDKPAGVHVHPMGPYRTGTLVNALLWHAGARPDDPWAAWRPYPGHRLDRPTSGLLAVMKRREHQDAFRRSLGSGAVERTYLATVSGEVDDEAGTLDAPLGPDPRDPYRRAVLPIEEGGQPAVTRWRAIERSPGRTVLEVQIDTGRTHQIRAHLAAMGHPIVGDDLYAGGRAAGAIALRAVRLAFPHPSTGQRVDVAAP